MNQRFSIAVIRRTNERRSNNERNGARVEGVGEGGGGWSVYIRGEKREREREKGIEKEIREMEIRKIGIEDRNRATLEIKKFRERDGDKSV